MGITFIRKSYQNTSRLFFSLAFITFLSFNSFSQDSTQATADTEANAGGAPNEEAIAAGKSIFENNCASCHILGVEGTYPNLVGVTERRSKEWLTKWITNPSKFAKENADAKALIEKWKPKGGVMAAFDWMSEEELNNTIAYLGVAKSGGDSGSEEATTTEGGQVVQSGSDNITSILMVVLVVLILIIVVLILMFSVIMKHLKEKDRSGELDEDDAELVNQKHSVVSVLKHPAFIGIVLVIGLAWGSWWFLQEVVFGIGVETGYQPVQPIPFSHKLHAGENQVDCNYCHTGVRKSKHAYIPSPSICMNCHTQVKTNSETLKRTLYKAMDWDPETGEFGPNQTPIEWVRVHNLPDHVYFNHAQHVQVGEIECEECHGPIKEMDGTVYQYSTLTMGWCIDCHRKTKLNTDGNAYYDNLVKRHEEVGEGDFTVEKNGGTECVRCHY